MMEFPTEPLTLGKIYEVLYKTKNKYDGYFCYQIILYMVQIN